MLLFQLLEYILKKILKQLRRSCLVSPITKNVTAHMCSSVDIGSEPHRFVPGRAPPHFTRYAGWVGGDASLSGVHVAVNLDGIFYTALVWIHPVFPYKRKWLIDSLHNCNSKINQQGSSSSRSKSPCTDNISWFIIIGRWTGKITADILEFIGFLLKKKKKLKQVFSLLTFPVSYISHSSHSPLFFMG